MEDRFVNAKKDLENLLTYETPNMEVHQKIMEECEQQPSIEKKVKFLEDKLIFHLKQHLELLASYEPKLYEKELSKCKDNLQTLKKRVKVYQTMRENLDKEQTQYMKYFYTVRSKILERKEVEKEKDKDREDDLKVLNKYLDTLWINDSPFQFEEGLKLIIPLYEDFKKLYMNDLTLQQNDDRMLWSLNPPKEPEKIKLYEEYTLLAMK